MLEGKVLEYVIPALGSSQGSWARPGPCVGLGFCVYKGRVWDGWPRTFYRLWLWVQHTCRCCVDSEVLPGAMAGDWTWLLRLNLAISQSHSWFWFPLLSGPGLHLKSYKHTLEGGPCLCLASWGWAFLVSTHRGPLSTSVGRAGLLAGEVSPWILAPELECAVCPPS